MSLRKRIARALAAAVLLSGSGMAQATTIAVIEHVSSISDPALAIDDAATSTIILGGGILSFGFTGLDAGGTLQWVANAATDGADFERLATTITNGIDNAIEVKTAILGRGLYSYLRAPESQFFASVAGLAGPDLAGFLIDAITVTVTDIEFLGGATSTLNSRTTYSIEGRVVPIPAAWLLMASALGGLGAAGRLRRRGQ